MGKYSYKQRKSGRKQSFKKRKHGGDPPLEKNENQKNAKQKDEERKTTENETHTTEDTTENETPKTEHTTENETPNTEDTNKTSELDAYNLFITELTSAQNDENVKKILNANTFIMETVKKVTLHNKKGDWKAIELNTNP